MAEHQGSTSSVIDRILADRPDVARHLGAAADAAPAATDPALLALCSRRVAQLLGGPPDDRFPVAQPVADALPQWPTDDRFDAVDRACLAFTEQFVIDVASMDDATALAVVDALGAEGFGNFVNALLVTEQRQRLRLIWDRLFSEDTP